MGKKRNIALLLIVRFVLAILLLAIGITVYALLVRTRPTPARSERTSEPPRVAVMEVRPVEVRRQWEGFGTAQAITSVNVPARVTATVEEIAEGIVAGAWVEAGELLVRLDDSDFARQVEISTQMIADFDAQLARIAVEVESWTERTRIAGEQVALAQAEFERVQEASLRSAALQREIDQARRALLTALRDETSAKEELDKIPSRRSGLEAQKLGQAASLRLAQQNVERCRIGSPITGILQEVDVEVGENIPAGQRVARVVDRSQIEVPLRLPAGARPSVRVGDRVELRSTSRRGQSWEARIMRIAPEDDGKTRTVTVFAEIEQDPGASGGLTPGQFLRGMIVTAESTLRWVVPRRAVRSDRILLVEDDLVVSRTIVIDYQVEARFPALGLDDTQWVVLEEPLPEAALVLVNASRALPDGIQVTPVLAGGLSSAEPAGTLEQSE